MSSGHAVTHPVKLSGCVCLDMPYGDFWGLVVFLMGCGRQAGVGVEQGGQ